MNPVEESATYWDKDDDHAEIVRKDQPKAKKREQAARVRRMADEAIDAFLDQAMLFCYCHIHCELLSQGKNRRPAVNQAAEDKRQPGNGKYSGP